MTYKEAIDRLRLLYRVNATVYKKPELKFNNTELLALLSIPYADICNNERLVQAKKDLTLVVGDYDYVVGTTATTIPADLLDVISVKYDEGGADEAYLERVEINEMPRDERESGVPTKYTIVYQNSSKVLLLDTLPDAAETLTIWYYKKIFTFAGTGDANSFSDWDESRTDFGGSFKSDTIWDNVIMLGALKELIPEKTSEYLAAYQQVKTYKPEFIGHTIESRSFGAATEDI